MTTYIYDKVYAPYRKSPRSHQSVPVTYQTAHWHTYLRPISKITEEISFHPSYPINLHLLPHQRVLASPQFRYKDQNFKTLGKDTSCDLTKEWNVGYATTILIVPKEKIRRWNRPMSGYVERSKFVEKKKLVGAILLSLTTILYYQLLWQ